MSLGGSVSDTMITEVTTAFAVIIGMLVLVWRKSADQYKGVQLNVPPKPVVVPDDDDEVDAASGKTKVTIFYGIQTGTAEGFAKGNDKGAWLQQLICGVFGLDNHQYENFRKIAKVLGEQLCEQANPRQESIQPAAIIPVKDP